MPLSLFPPPATPPGGAYSPLSDIARRTALVLWLVLLLAVVVLSLHPRTGPPTVMHIDKILHLGGYGLLAALPFLAMARRGGAWGAALAMIPMGVALELLQDLVPGRDSDIEDLIANIVGASAGLVLGQVFRRLAGRFGGG